MAQYTFTNKTVEDITKIYEYTLEFYILQNYWNTRNRDC